MKFQLTLSNMLLLTTAVALSVVLWIQRSRNEVYEDQLPGLRKAARELVVSDPTQFHAVASHALWMGEEAWKIHVPASGTYKLNLQTTGIAIGRSRPYKTEFPTAEASLKLAAGTHKVELLERDDDGYEIEVLVDDESAFLLEMDRSRYPKNTSINQNFDVRNCESFPAGEEVKLFHLKISPKGQTSTNKQHDGILLWVTDN